MNKQMIGSVCLVAGTAIGAGVLALPIVFAKVGILGSLFFMTFTWYVAYFTALIAVELNLQAGVGLPLGSLGKRFSGYIAQVIGNTSVKLLCYALFAAYLCGSADVGSSILQEMGISCDPGVLKHIMAGSFILILMVNVAGIAAFNEILFFGVAIVLGLAIIAVVPTDVAVGLEGKPLSENISVFPVLFTSFGFQVVFHTLTDYCEKDAKTLKRVFFWGTIIPFLLYFLWTIGSLVMISQVDKVFYDRMIANDVQLSEMLKVLASSAEQGHGMCAWMLKGISGSNVLFLSVSLLAILTSLIGVGVGLATSWKKMLPEEKLPCCGNKLSAVIAVVPSWALASFFPGLFIKFLGVAGCVLTVIAIYLPMYLLYKQRKSSSAKPYYPIVDNKVLQVVSAILGLLVWMGELGIC